MTPLDPAPPELRFAFRVEVDLDAPVEVVEHALGRRRIIPIVGGTAAGPGLSGRVLPGGADVQLVRPDGVTEIEARYAVDFGDAGRVYIHNTGYRRAAPEDVERLLRGEPVDPERVYFRTCARIETGAGSPLPFADSLVIGVGERAPDSVRVDFFTVS